MFAIVRKPLDGIEYFAGYRHIGNLAPTWSDDTIRTYHTSRLAQAVVDQLGEGIVVTLDVKYSTSPTIQEIDDLTNDYDGDI